MFPLGSVLFPGAVLPLHVFEPRYLQLVADIADDGGRFGVVLIQRGSEVGGGDMRSNFGTVARIVRQGETEDGRILLTAIGTQRFRVTEWLEDDPYPQAIVEPQPEVPAAPETGDAVAAASAARRRLLGIAIEMGASGQQLEIELADDPSVAAWTMCAAAPLGSFDRQKLLETDDHVDRMRTLQQMLEDQTRDLENALRREN